MLDTTESPNGQTNTAFPVYLSEKTSNNYFRKQPAKSIQVLTGEKQINLIKFIDTAGVDVYLNRLYGNNIDIYSNNIFIISSNGTYSFGHMPYLEGGLGVGNIFKILRIDIIKRFNYLDHPGITPFGLKLSFSPNF
jgi:hypothetical protein